MAGRKRVSRQAWSRVLSYSLGELSGKNVKSKYMGDSLKFVRI